MLTSVLFIVCIALIAFGFFCFIAGIVSGDMDVGVPLFLISMVFSIFPFMGFAVRSRVDKFKSEKLSDSQYELVGIRNNNHILVIDCGNNHLMSNIFQDSVINKILDSDQYNIYVQSSIRNDGIIHETWFKIFDYEGNLVYEKQMTEDFLYHVGVQTYNINNTQKIEKE